ncbi:5'/3'-nucleotidase SurE [Haloglomus litoreum]|uniref:5'/3'-nucleotidase SurE n=1 Tax=Haloglomus litoreum TaxID=3034026 RepID=UPI0023E77EEB|nr:5'/3'-nucleotidase SurE [Haloglomus sp. DT116]
MNVLLTNDDGIDAPGLRALADALDALGEVTVVAPASNQSAVGRGLSYGRMGPDGGNDGDLGLGEDPEDPFTVHIPHEEHELGYAVHGTPCDCVILGIGAFEPDIVVAGCNAGANLGVHVLPRSGTASAAVEAASLGVPGVAVSMDVIGLDRDGLAPSDFERAARVGRAVVERALDRDAFTDTDYLNVNVPRPDRDLAGVAVTRPTPQYDMHADLADGRFALHNPLHAGMAEGDIPDDEGTDRRALLEDRVSISPLTLPRHGIDASVFDRLDEVFADVAALGR